MSHTLREQVEKIMKQTVTDQAYKKRKKFEKVVLEVPVIDVETGLEPVEFQPTGAPIMDPLTIDIVKACEKKVDVIEQQRDELTYKCQDLQNELELLQLKIRNRDTENQRIGTQLEVARSNQFNNLGAGPAVTSDGPINANEAAYKLPIAKQRIEQLEVQLEHLHDYTSSLEKRIEDFDTDRENLVRLHDDEKATHIKQLDKERQNNEALVKNVNKLERMVSEFEKSHKFGPESKSRRMNFLLKDVEY